MEAERGTEREREMEAEKGTEREKGAEGDDLATALMAVPPDVTSPGNTAMTAPYMYERLENASSMDGNLYEIKYLMLMFLRGINQVDDFSVACNVKLARPLDDAVLTFTCRTTRHKHSLFVQLKHKQDTLMKDGSRTKKLLPANALASVSGDFAIVKYCNAYLDIKNNFREQDFKHFGSVHQHTYVLFTTATLADYLKPSPPTDNCVVHSMLNTGEGGQVKVFDSHSDAEFCRKIQNMVELKELLACIKAAVDGVDENDMKEAILKLDATMQERINEAKKQNTVNVKNFFELPKKQVLEALWKNYSAVPGYEDFTEFLTKFRLYADQESHVQLEKYIKSELRNAKHVWKGVDEKDLNAIYEDLFKVFEGWWSSPDKKTTCMSEQHKAWAAHCVAALSGEKSVELDVHCNEVCFTGDELTKIQNVVRTKSGAFSIVAEESPTLTTLKIYQAFRSDKTTLCIFVGLAKLLRQTDNFLYAWQLDACRTMVVECERDFPHTSAQLERLHSAIAGICAGALTPIRCFFVSHSCGLFAKNLRRISMASYASLTCENRWYQLKTWSREAILSRMVSFQSCDIELVRLVNDDNRLTEHVNGECLSELALRRSPIGPRLAELIPDYVHRRLHCVGPTPRVVRVHPIADEVVLVVAEPGMGKTTFLTLVASAAKKDDPEVWIVRLNLNECTRHLRNNTFEDDDTLLDFVFKCLRLDTEMERTLLGKSLFNAATIPVVVLVDSVDEVWSAYKGNVCRLLSRLRQCRQRQLWVASRKLCVETLEGVLGVSSHVLEPFDADDQKNFFNSFWKSRGFVVSEEQSSAFTEYVMRLATDAGENSLISNPLLIRMVGEYFVDTLKAFVEARPSGTIPSRIDTVSLYEDITYKIFLRYCKDKKNEDFDNASAIIDIEANWKYLKEEYGKTALYLLVESIEDIRSLISLQDTQAFVQRIKDGKELTGIVDYVMDEDKPHFVHPSIAEFFSAAWLTEHRDRAAVQDFIRANLARPEFQAVFSFFDRMLVRDLTPGLHSAVIERDWKDFSSVLETRPTELDATDAGGRTALHIAAMYAGVFRASVFRDMVNALVEAGASVGVVDGILGWTAMDYADYTEAWTVAGIMLRRSGNTQDMSFSRRNMKTELFEVFTEFLSTEKDDPTNALLVAAKHGNVSVLRYLVSERKANVECASDDGKHPMHEAAAAGMVQAMAYLREVGASCHVADNRGNTPLMAAAKNGHLEATKYFFPTIDGAQANIFNNDGWSALMFALEAGDMDIVEYLISHGAFIEMGGFECWSLTQKNAVLMWLCFKGDFEETKALVEKHDASMYCNRQGATPLHWAVMSRNHELVQYLVTTIGQITHRDRERNTVLHYLSKTCNSFGQSLDSSENSIAIAELLVQAGADVLAANIDEELPKDIATRSGYCDLAGYLARGEDAARVLAEEREAKREQVEREELARKGRGLLEAVRDGEREKMFNWIENGARIDSVDAAGRNALHIAADLGHTHLVSDLANVDNADVDAADNDGNTAFHIASMQRNVAMMDRLASHQCSMTTVNREGLTPLLTAAHRGNWDVARYIAQRNRSALSASDTAGRTVLHIACAAHALLEVAYFAPLVDSVGPRDSDGDTPLTIAITQDCPVSIVEALLGNGADLTEVFSQYSSRPALHIAVQFGRLAALESILAKYAGNVSDADRNGNAPIHTAVRNRDVPIVQCLADNGARLNAADTVGDSSMHIAARIGALQVIECLLKYEGVKMAVGDVEGRTPLEIATSEGWEDVVAFLRSFKIG